MHAKADRGIRSILWIALIAKPTNCTGFVVYKAKEMHPLSGRTIIFLPGLDGTGISFEPLAQVLPLDVNVKVIRYPRDGFLSFEETVRYAMDQIPPDTEDGIVLAESFSGPVAIALVGSGRLRAKCLILCSTFAKSPRPALMKVFSYLPLELLIRFPFPRFLLSHMVEGGQEATDLFLAMCNG